MNVWSWVTIGSIMALLIIVGSVLGINYWVSYWLEKVARDWRQKKKPAVLETIIAGDDGVPLKDEARLRRARSIAAGTLNPKDPETTKRP